MKGIWTTKNQDQFFEGGTVRCPEPHVNAVNLVTLVTSGRDGHSANCKWVYFTCQNEHFTCRGHCSNLKQLISCKNRHITSTAWRDRLLYGCTSENDSCQPGPGFRQPCCHIP
jgi:hypothetical protein